MKYERLTKRKDERCWQREEFWLSAEEPDDEEVDKVYDRLADLEDKIDNGKLVESEFKFGERVWAIYNTFYTTESTFVNSRPIHKWKLFGKTTIDCIYVLNSNGKWKFTYRLKDRIATGKKSYLDENDKTNVELYKTKRQAEARLKKLEGKK